MPKRPAALLCSRADPRVLVNLAKLPSTCFVVDKDSPPGARVRVIEAGSRHLKLTDLDDPEVSEGELQRFVEMLNKRMCVNVAQACAMVAGVREGWHLACADPDNYYPATRSPNA